MDYDQIGALLLVAGVLTSIFLRIRRQRRPTLYITDYQHGLLFVDGVFQEVLGPGPYRPDGSKRQITVVDLRPRLVLVERVFYSNAMQAPSVVSVAAQLKVIDAHAATARLKDITSDSLGVLRDAVRATVSKTVAAHSEQARRATEKEIQKSANGELEKGGMSVSSVEITEAWSRVTIPRRNLGAN